MHRALNYICVCDIRESNPPHVSDVADTVDETKLTRARARFLARYFVSYLYKIRLGAFQQNIHFMGLNWEEIRDQVLYCFDHLHHLLYSSLSICFSLAWFWPFFPDMLFIAFRRFQPRYIERDMIRRGGVYIYISIYGASMQYGWVDSMPCLSSLQSFCRLILCFVVCSTLHIWSSKTLIEIALRKPVVI